MSGYYIIDADLSEQKLQRFNYDDSNLLKQSLPIPFQIKAWNNKRFVR